MSFSQLEADSCAMNASGVPSVRAGGTTPDMAEFSSTTTLS
jgi:hypothetical protein